MESGQLNMQLKLLIEFLSSLLVKILSIHVVIIAVILVGLYIVRSMTTPIQMTNRCIKLYVFGILVTRQKLDTIFRGIRACLKF